MKKIISFCLYGNRATYILGMKENIILGKKYFPTWEIRIYYNETVPEKYIKEYIEMGAICEKCENIGFNKMNWEGMFWRFFPLNDPDVECWLSRDADSRLSLRESKLVDEWLKSNKTLYTIRDHRCHYHPIMGGLFGINNKLFHEKYKLDTIKNIITNLYGYYKERPYNVDQIFLNDNLWNLLKDDVFTHISNGGRRIYDSDINVPSVPDFIGKQYRLNDFPENIIKKLDKNKGCYWKKSNCASVYWSNNSTDIKPDIKFKNEGEYYVHRVEHGYPQNWSGINIFDGIDIKKDIESEPPAKNPMNTQSSTVNNSYSKKEKFKNLNVSFFERIYIIHLNRLLDRKKNILNQIRLLSNVIIIDAVDKDNINLEHLKQNNLIGFPGNDYCKDPNNCWCGGNGHNDMMKTGRIACAWSHSKAYEHIIHNNIGNALIIEDDFLLCDDFINIFKDIQCNIPEDYDMLYMAHNKHFNRKQNTIYNSYFNKTNTGFSETSCYAITNKTAFNLQQNLFPIRGAADGYIRQCIDYLKTIKNVYICKYNLVSNQSMYRNIKSTIDINIENNKDKDNSNNIALFNNVLKKHCLEYKLNEPLVSIAISTYEANGKGINLLRHNLENIQKQNYYNIEVVISDHSSDDKIKKLCENFISKTTTYFKYPIKYIHNPEHKGNSSQNTNNAIKHCSGEYIKILFMDDYLYNDNAISIIVKKMQENPDKKWLVHSYKHTKDYKDFYNLHHPKFSHDIVFCNRIGTPSCLTIHNSVKERFDENLK
jgi:GR25 family glycosyltransferase involved in LPS biosynthesis